MKARIISGGTVQEVTEVLQYARGRVLIKCFPDRTPRWVSLEKPVIRKD